MFHTREMSGDVGKGCQHSDVVLAEPERIFGLPGLGGSACMPNAVETIDQQALACKPQESWTHGGEG